MAVQRKQHSQVTQRYTFRLVGMWLHQVVARPHMGMQTELENEQLKYKNRGSKSKKQSYCSNNTAHNTGLQTAPFCKTLKILQGKKPWRHLTLGTQPSHHHPQCSASGIWGLETEIATQEAFPDPGTEEKH